MDPVIVLMILLILVGLALSVPPRWDLAIWLSDLNDRVRKKHDGR